MLKPNDGAMLAVFRISGTLTCDIGLSRAVVVKKPFNFDYRFSIHFLKVVVKLT